MTSLRHEPIGDLCEVISGPAFKSADFGDEGEGTRLLRGENIEPGSLRWSKTRTWPDELLDAYAHLLIEPGDLILGMDRPVVAAGLKLAVVRSGDCPALLVQRVARIRPRGVDGRYLRLWLSSQRFVDYLKTNSTGTQLPHVTLKSIRDFLVPRFDPQTERRIVDVLEDHLSRLDAATAGLKTALARSEALLTSVLWHSTHGLDGAETLELESVADVRLGRQRSPKNHLGDRMRPYLRAANVDWDSLRLDDVKQMQFTEAEEATYRLEPGDILVTEASGSPAEVGKSTLYKGEPAEVCFQNTLLRVRCHAANPEFVQKYLLAEARAGRFMPEARGVGINHLGKARLVRFAIELPRPDVQAAAVASIRDLIDQTERLRVSIREQQRKTARLRRFLLVAAFSGRLTGHDRDLRRVEAMVEA